MLLALLLVPLSLAAPVDLDDLQANAALVAKCGVKQGFWLLNNPLHSLYANFPYPHSVWDIKSYQDYADCLSLIASDLETFRDRLGSLTLTSYHNESQNWPFHYETSAQERTVMAQVFSALRQMGPLSLKQIYFDGMFVNHWLEEFLDIAKTWNANSVVFDSLDAISFRPKYMLGYSRPFHTFAKTSSVKQVSIPVPEVFSEKRIKSYFNEFKHVESVGLVVGLNAFEPEDALAKRLKEITATPEAAAAILNARKEYPKLESLRIRAVSASDLPAFSTSLTSNSVSLTKLYLKDYDFFRDAKEYDSFFEKVSASPLETFGLNLNCPVPEPALQSTIDALVKNGLESLELALPLKDYSFVGRLTSLTSLSIQLPFFAKDALHELLTAKNNLKSLSLSVPEIKSLEHFEMMLKRIVDALIENPGLETLYFAASVRTPIETFTKGCAVFVDQFARLGEAGSRLVVNGVSVSNYVGVSSQCASLQDKFESSTLFILRAY